MSRVTIWSLCRECKISYYEESKGVNKCVYCLNPSIVNPNKVVIDRKTLPEYFEEDNKKKKSRKQKCLFKLDF
jgi:hypothetical protein